MKHFDKEKAFDDIIKIILKAGSGESISRQMKAYSEAMEYLEGIANTQFEMGYMEAMEVGKELNQN